MPATYTVYDGDQLVLTVVDTPGPLRSTASLPPGVAPVTHPFLTATAHSAVHEHALQAALGEANDTTSFLDALRAQGLRVEATAP